MAQYTAIVTLKLDAPGDYADAATMELVKREIEGNFQLHSSKVHLCGIEAKVIGQGKPRETEAPR